MIIYEQTQFPWVNSFVLSELFRCENENNSIFRIKKRNLNAIDQP